MNSIDSLKVDIIRLGDISNHGGRMISASANFTTNGIRTCVDGDLHSCPIPAHGVTPVAARATFKSDGKWVVKIGDRAGCGAALDVGSPDTFTYLNRQDHLDIVRAAE